MIYLDLFWTFFKIGAFTFGGGYAMLPLIKAEVLAHGWMTEQMVLDVLAISEATPGPYATNMATYVGMNSGGVLGAVCATLGVVLPSVVIIILIAKMYEKYKKNKVIAGCMTGLKPAIVGLLGAAIVSTATTVFGGVNIFDPSTISPQSIALFIIFLLVLVLEFVFKKVSPIWWIVISLAAGVVLGYAGVFG